jgi:hypothetical protein
MNSLDFNLTNNKYQPTKAYQGAEQGVSNSYNKALPSFNSSLYSCSPAEREREKKLYMVKGGWIRG